MAPGSEPDTVNELIQLIEPYVYGKQSVTVISGFVNQTLITY